MPFLPSASDCTVALPHRCLKDLADECAHDNGGCWQADFTVNRQKKHYTACQDNIQAYKVNTLSFEQATFPPGVRQPASACVSAA